MADVFISYKREDRPLAEALDAHLQKAGFSTWWDTSLVAGEQFNAAIAGALAEARCIVVLWNKQSHASLFVQAEAIDGFTREILVAARLDNVALKYPYTIIQTADLQSWKGEADHPGLAEIVAGVHLKLKQAPALPAHYPKTAPGIPIVGRAARANDPSIWEDPASPFAFQEASQFVHANRTLAIEDGPRAYARVIPAGWSDGPFSVAEFAKHAQTLEISAPSNGYQYGSYGFSYFGALQTWFAGHGPQSTGYGTQNACLYFDDTGEFWVVHGTAVPLADRGNYFVLPEPTIANWSKTLRYVMRLYDEHGASPERRVVFGVVGLDNAFWPDGRQSSIAAPRARKPSMLVDRQIVGWSQDQQLDFLRLAYNELRGVFSLPKLDQKQFKADMMAFDPPRFG